jgi:hypothetical protein
MRTRRVAYIVLENCQVTTSLSASLAERHSAHSHVLSFATTTMQPAQRPTHPHKLDIVHSGTALYIPWQSPSDAWARIDLATSEPVLSWTEQDP